MDNNRIALISRCDQDRALFKEIFMAFEESERVTFIDMTLESSDEEFRDSVNSTKDTRTVELLRLGGSIAFQEMAIRILDEKNAK